MTCSLWTCQATDSQMWAPLVGKQWMLGRRQRFSACRWLWRPWWTCSIASGSIVRSLQGTLWVAGLRWPSPRSMPIVCSALWRSRRTRASRAPASGDPEHVTTLRLPRAFPLLLHRRVDLRPSSAGGMRLRYGVDLHSGGRKHIRKCWPGVFVRAPGMLSEHSWAWASLASQASGQQMLVVVEALPCGMHTAREMTNLPHWARSFDPS
mmetsp:Transcript_60590/g.133163  ORF Transcript_60590/g.133163 Transcript_60590/m.133163 type:complete len:208 (-) Transcript_60590:1068-1691(-)